MSSAPVDPEIYCRKSYVLSPIQVLLVPLCTFETLNAEIRCSLRSSILAFTAETSIHVKAVSNSHMPRNASTLKVGLEPRGAFLAVLTGACLAGGYSLLNDHDLIRIKKSVTGGALSFFGAYLFIRGSHFDDAQTGAVVAAITSLISIFAYSRLTTRRP